MAQTIAVLSQKGGTGKTTAVRTLADALRRSGVRTLAVDLDPQGNLSDYFDLAGEDAPAIADVLSGRSRTSEAIRCDLIPANLSLAETELMMGGKMGRELTLRRVLAEAPEGYQVILFGHHDHPESRATISYTAHGMIIESLAEAEALPRFPKIAALAQTTVRLSDYEQVCAVLATKCDDFENKGQICAWTRLAQEEAGGHGNGDGNDHEERNADHRDAGQGDVLGRQI